MTTRSPNGGFASRPADPERWVKATERQGQRTHPSEAFSARLTIDVTTDMRGRIKVAAFQRGQTVADMLRALLEREFPSSQGDAR